MKMTAQEFDGQYNIDLEAETLEDAGFIVRLAMNTAHRAPCIFSYVSAKGEFSGGIYFDKRKDSQGTIIKMGEKKAKP